MEVKLLRLYESVLFQYDTVNTASTTYLTPYIYKNMYINVAWCKTKKDLVCCAQGFLQLSSSLILIKQHRDITVIIWYSELFVLEAAWSHSVDRRRLCSSKVRRDDWHMSSWTLCRGKWSVWAQDEETPSPRPSETSLHFRRDDASHIRGQQGLLGVTPRCTPCHQGCWLLISLLICLLEDTKGSAPPSDWITVLTDTAS